MDFLSEVSKFNITLTKEMEDKFNEYFTYLVSYNEHTNLTAITDHDEVFSLPCVYKTESVGEFLFCFIAQADFFR